MIAEVQFRYYASSYVSSSPDCNLLCTLPTSLYYSILHFERQYIINLKIDRFPRPVAHHWLLLAEVREVQNFKLLRPGVLQ